MARNRIVGEPIKKVKKGTFMRLIGHILEHKIRLVLIAFGIIITTVVNIGISLFLKIESYYERGLCQTCFCNFEEAISDFTVAIEIGEMDINYSDRLQEFREIRSATYEALEVKKEVEQESLFCG